MKPKTGLHWSVPQHSRSEDSPTREPLRTVQSVFIFRAVIAALMAAGFVVAQEHISFPTQDGGVSTPMSTGEASAPLCWHMEGGSTRRVGRSRRERSQKQDFGFWQSTSAVTVNPRGLKIGQ